MKILGILGGHKRDGLTAQMLTNVLSGVSDPHTTETIYLEDFQFHPDLPGHRDPVLDQLTVKLLESDVWVLAAPTYWGGLAGQMKDFLDCMRGRLVRFDHNGGTHPDRFKDKHYLSITSCYAGTVENFLTGVTDASFRTIDKIMSAAGLIKINELVLPGTLKMTTLPKSKQQLCTHWGQKLTTKTKRDDNTVKRYIELFCMVAVMALITMGVQLLLHLIPIGQFWSIYATFVIIFFVLLASILHFFTVVKHRRR
ncbi:NADPH-dependent FMN reductase [Secundilactobacillus odoratitofui DSM 19909 = JCM 15043]|uniref:NADPH-dependent FMN reductase n=1 Tax=Secundilactobacillus odoratitofui DSM 19909 = JCM 15043 TaxID=1423776 RepID=A0A0R1LWZ5_9LACO|nr:flavodoxin family protein [Secundilactobacillus odoratitofui]KRK98147.1 NADPH-dependent FMN reductase [Secundilactobacillus odoratitofui DSM 19909 = JCM 15043]